MSDTTTTCESCPSYLTADAVPGVFAKNIGSPMCARFGHVLGKPGLKPVQQAKITKHFSTNCGEAGSPIPVDIKKKPDAQVSIGDISVMKAGPPAEADRVRVSSCLDCQNYVRPDAVHRELGWPAGLCAANGRLILPHLVNEEARDCEWRNPGGNRGTTDGIDLMPIYADAFGMDTDPIKAFMARRKSGKPGFVEPSEYPTDRPVETTDAAAGIRAWRRIDDPDGSGNFTFLPIYKADGFSEGEQAKIPLTGSDEHPEMYVDHAGHVYRVAVAWRELDETPMVWGIAGTGKTELFRHIAWLMNLPFDRISITADSRVDDIIGKMGAEESANKIGTVTNFTYGRLPKRWVLPGVLLLDEPNVGPEEVWQAIRPLTDNSKQLVIDQNSGERLSRNIDCYLGMAGNPAWDVRNIGANPMADADGNRLVHLWAPLPPPEIERAILEDRCALDGYNPTGVIDSVMSIAQDIRGMSDDQTLPISWGIRPQIKVIRMTRWFTLEESYRLAVGNLIEPEQAQVIFDIVKTHVA